MLPEAPLHDPDARKKAGLPPLPDCYPTYPPDRDGCYRRPDLPGAPEPLLARLFAWLTGRAARRS